MTGDRIKFEGSGENGGRLEARSGLTRRRLAKPTSLRENGSLKFESDLALALKESLKYAKQTDTDPKPMEDTSIKRSNIENQNDDLKATNSSRIESIGEKQLRELVCLHIDLIQHQQELIIQKDKQIKQFKQEKDTVSPNRVSSHIIMVIKTNKVVCFLVYITI